jgi:hypothetical protein
LRTGRPPFPCVQLTLKHFTLWGGLANLRPIGKSASFVGQPILAAAGFQRHDATGSRWIEPLTAPQNRLVENKWFIGAVTGEPALFVSRFAGFRPPQTLPKGPSPARVNALRVGGVKVKAAAPFQPTAGNRKGYRNDAGQVS